MTKISIFKFSFTTALLIVLAVLLTGSQALAWSNASFNQNQTIQASALSTGNSGTALSKSSSSLPTSTKINYDTLGNIESYETSLSVNNKKLTLSITARYNSRGDTASKITTLLSAQEVSSIYSLVKNTAENWPTNVLLMPEKISIRNYGDDSLNKANYKVKAGDTTLELNVAGLLRNMDMHQPDNNTTTLVEGLAAYIWDVNKETAAEEKKESSFIRNWKTAREISAGDDTAAKDDFTYTISSYYQHLNTLDYAQAQVITQFFLVPGEANKVWTYSVDSQGTVSAQKSALIVIENTDSEDEDNPDYGKRYTVPENMPLYSGWEKISG